MNTLARQSPVQFLLVTAVTQIVRRRYLSLSILAHVVLLALMYYYGSYQPELRQEAADVASSLRATSRAVTAKRLEDLQTIKQLLEKSADRVDTQPESGPDPVATPETPEEMLERAQDLSKAIEELDKEIQAEELGKLTGVPESPPAPEPQPLEPPTTQPPAAAVPPANVTQDQAARAVAELEAEARVTLARRLQRLEAKENGVQVEGQKPGSGEGEGEGSSAGASSNQRSGSDMAVRTQIGEFIDARERMEKTAERGSYSSLGYDIFDRGYLEVPPVDASSLVLGRGRMLGAGGEYANRVYVNTWYIIGPFAGRNGMGLFDNPAYPPEKAVLLDAVYYGKDQRLLKWRYVTAQTYPLYPPDMVEDSVYYGYTEVFVDRACDLTAWFGSDDDLQIYVNDRLVWKGGNVGKQTYFDTIFNPNTTFERDYNRTEGKRVVHFNKGRNKVLFKLSNGPNLGFLSMVLTRQSP
jgi:hypothetical protein